jgi:hypothetical protein
MAIVPLYEPRRERIVFSNANFEKGIEEITAEGARLATLAEFQEQRQSLKNRGVDAYGRTATGIVVVPASYALNQGVCRAIVQRCIPSLNPAGAVEANRNNKWYAHSNKGEVAESLIGAVLINEELIKNNILLMGFKEFTGKFLKYGLALWGGEGTDEQRLARVEAARDYFIKELADKKKKQEGVSLYLPHLESIRDSNLFGENPIGTSIWAGALGGGFLLGGSGNLYGDGGVLGVRNASAEGAKP